MCIRDSAERMRAVAASKNANLSDVTISKKLIIEENDHAVTVSYTHLDVYKRQVRNSSLSVQRKTQEDSSHL